MIQIALLTEFVRKTPPTHPIYLFHSGKKGVRGTGEIGSLPSSLSIYPTFSQSSISGQKNISVTKINITGEAGEQVPGQIPKARFPSE